MDPLYTDNATRNGVLDLAYSMWAYFWYLAIPGGFFTFLLTFQFAWKVCNDLFGLDLTGWLYYYNDNA